MSVELELAISAVILVSMVVGALVVLWLATEGMVWLIIRMVRILQQLNRENEL